VYKIREYNPAINVHSIIIGINIFDIDKILEINEISLIKFKDGGAPIFAEINKNHHKLIIGKIDSIPLFKSILRDCEDS
jgi:hypothetical protein